LSREIEPISGARLKAILEAKGLVEVVVFTRQRAATVPINPPNPGIWIMRDTVTSEPGKMPIPVQKLMPMSVKRIMETINILGIDKETYFKLLDAIP
jgi:hypothetical protein